MRSVTKECAECDRLFDSGGYYLDSDYLCVVCADFFENNLILATPECRDSYEQRYC